MTVLYILGAGCSKNYDQSESPVPDLEPPLNNNFFKMAKKVIDYYGYNSLGGPILGLDHLVRNLAVLNGYPDVSGDTSVLNDDGLTLEGVMNYFYLKNGILDRDPAFPSVSSYRIRALNELLAFTLAESLQGENCQKHLKLARKMKKGDVVWSLNYDILIDNALFAIGKVNDSGYIIRFDYTMVDNNWRMTEDDQSEINIFKLHGSLNWLRCRNCGRNLLLRGRKSVPEIRLVMPTMTIHCPKCKATWQDLERIIIPPSGVKDFSDLDVRYLWRSAASFGNKVDCLIVIGYRFSEFDFELDMLLRSMIESGALTSDIPITIVNPEPERVGKRVSGIFKKSNQTMIRSFENFLSDGSTA